MKTNSPSARNALCAFLLFFSAYSFAQLKENSANIEQVINVPGMAVVINPGGSGCKSSNNEKWEPTENGCSNIEWVKQTARVVSVTASPSTILANNISTSTLTATVKDGNGLPVKAGIPTTWRASNGSLGAGYVLTNSAGQAVNSLRGTVAGFSTITAGAAAGAASTNVTLLPDPSTSRVVALSANPPTVAADGTPAGLFATVRDAYNNLLPAGQTVYWSTTMGSLSANTSLTDGNGVAYATVASTAPGAATIYAKTPVSDNAATGVSFTATNPVINSFDSVTKVGKKTYHDSLSYSGSGLQVAGTTISWNVTGATRYEVYYSLGTVTGNLQYSGSGTSFEPRSLGIGPGNGVWTLKAFNGANVTVVTASFMQLDFDCSACGSGS